MLFLFYNIRLDITILSLRSGGGNTASLSGLPPMPPGAPLRRWVERATSILAPGIAAALISLPSLAASWSSSAWASFSTPLCCAWKTKPIWPAPGSRSLSRHHKQHLDSPERSAIVKRHHLLSRSDVVSITAWLQFFAPGDTTYRNRTRLK